MLPLSSTALAQQSLLASGGIAQNPIVQAIFAQNRYSSQQPNNGLLAQMENPANGFDPFKTESGTEVRFVPNPSQLGIPFGAQLAANWHNSLGIVLFRNAEVDQFGAIAIHGLRRNSWSEIPTPAGRDYVWQALGGCMAFTDEHFEGNAADDAAIRYALSTVLDKAMAMTPKWQFIDDSLRNAGHQITTDLGGAKSVHLHQPGNDAKRASIAVVGEVASIIGAYIAGADQNMGGEWSNELGRHAPINFMGATTTHELYRGMDNPSPWTAMGTYEGLKAARDKIMAGRKVPIFFQGYGGVGSRMVALATDDGHQVAGISEVFLAPLLRARKDGVTAPLFLDVSGMNPSELTDATEDAEGYDITFVNSLQEAISRVPNHLKPRIFSPNAGAHPLTRDVAHFIVEDTDIRIIVGAANNMLGLINGSPEPIAWYLQNNEVYLSNDSATNRMGALSVTVKKIGLDEAGLEAQVRRVGIGRQNEIDEGFLRGVPPQLYADRQAQKAWNQLLHEGLAVGGYFYTHPIAPPSDEDLKKLMGIA